MKRYFIYLAYNGKNYCGWQIQPNGISIQETLEHCLTALLRAPISVTGAGRTDAGVHAREMAAHFDVAHIEDPAALLTHLNRFLPPDIAVYRIVETRNDAHARFDALSRTYKYYVTVEKNPFVLETVYRTNFPLDFDAMNRAAALLFEYDDFTSFSKLHTDVKTNICRIMQAKWTKENDEIWVFTIQADRFLRNMVRAIVGTLFDIGRGKMSPSDFRKIIESKDRRQAGTSAPAHALFLHSIEYPNLCR